MTGTFWLGELPRLQDRIAAASPGPWRSISGGVIALPAATGVHSDIDNIRHYGGSLVAESMSHGDAEFVACARTDIPVLLGIIDVLAAHVDQLEGALAAAAAMLSDEQLAQLRSSVPMSLDITLERRRTLIDREVTS